MGNQINIVMREAITHPPSGRPRCRGEPRRPCRLPYPNENSDPVENGAPAARLRGSKIKRHRESPTPIWGMAMSFSPNHSAGKPCNTDAGGPPRVRNSPRRNLTRSTPVPARNHPEATRPDESVRPRRRFDAPRRDRPMARLSRTRSHPEPRRPAGRILTPPRVAGARSRARMATRSIGGAWDAPAMVRSKAANASGSIGPG